MVDPENEMNEIHYFSFTFTFHSFTFSLDKSAKTKDCSSSSDGERSSGHRVTFNDKNEVASQDKDGKFKVTYRQLGEKIKNQAETNEPKKAALKVQYGEKSRLELVPIAPKTLNFNDSTFDSDLYQPKDSYDR